MSELKKIRVQHVTRGDDGLEVKTDVDVLTDASAVTMDGKDLKSGIGEMMAKFKSEAEIEEMIARAISNLGLSRYAKKDNFEPNFFNTRFGNYKTMTAVIDQSNPDPLASVTYADDAANMIKGSANWDEFFGTRLVLFRNGLEIRTLKDDELNDLSEEDGDVMVKFDRMGLNIKTEGSKVYISMTNNPDNPDFKYYAHTRGDERREAFYVGAYLGSLKDDKLKSYTGKKPAEEKTIGDFRKAAQANGVGYELLGFYQLTFLQAMYVLKYGNLDSQTALGKGLTADGGNKSTPNTTGATNNKGIDFGSANDMEHVRFQYIEDFYGNREQFIDGIKVDDDNNILANIGDLSNESSYIRNGKASEFDGFVKAVIGTSELGFFPKACDENEENIHYCDYSEVWYGGAASFGGGVWYGADAGAFCLYAGWGSAYAGWALGARLMFL